MTDDREVFKVRRDRGLAKRHETREARAIRRQVAEEIAQACDARCLAITEGSEGLSGNELWTHVGLARGWDLAGKLAREIGSKEAT
jgi:hypothetical protein